MKSEKLILELERKGISKLQLALKVGIHPSIIYDAINGRRVFHPAYKRKIATFLEVDEVYLFGED
ncbi:MAG: hypothetical protein CVU94_02010 [Firmicutes bacterium HGW-Firmicutes-19]|nr:MAG: hypothetical protein CVU94_02010 [Firmicutes bacterium HGW-Firmicutes-19]